MPQPLRFLKYETPVPVVVGLLHQASNLRCLLLEAHATGRLAVLPSLGLMPEYNFGIRLDWRWEHYFDLAASSLTDADGHRWPLPIGDAPPLDAVETVRVRGREAIPEKARDCPLVVRRLFDPRFNRVLPMDAWPAAKVDLRASVRAAALARTVVRHLQSVGDGQFVGVHVRRGDRVTAGEYPEWITEPAHIERCLRERGVADGTTLFLASDEPDPDFWRPLQKTYRLFRYVDFPHLLALVSRAGPTPPDNYLLFRVELEVLRHGCIRLSTFPTPAWEHEGSLTPRRPRKWKWLETLKVWRWRWSSTATTP